MIIGITGTMGSGKGEIAKYLKNKGFEYFCFSDILKEEAKKRNISPTRENLQKLGNEIKKEAKTLGILAKKIIEKAKTNKVIADGIRNPDEVMEFRKRKDFYLIGITASQRLRYQRLKKRARPGDPTNFKEFKRIDNKENRGVTKGQEINKCLKITDFLIENKGLLEELREKVDKILAKINA